MKSGIKIFIEKLMALDEKYEVLDLNINFNGLRPKINITATLVECE